MTIAHHTDVPASATRQAPASITLAGALNAALADALADDPNVVVFGEDVGPLGGVFRVTDGLAARFGESRVWDSPLAEAGIVGTAIGMAVYGFKPVVEIMLMNFTAVCMDQITNHAAKLRFMSGGQTHVPMVIRTMTGSGMQNGGQHSDFLEAWFCHTPGIKVVMPSTPARRFAQSCPTCFAPG